MDSEQVIALCKPHFPMLKSLIQQAFDEFDEYLPPHIRLGAEDSRPKFVNVRMVDLVRARFGTSADNPVRLQKMKSVRVLFVAGRKFSVAIRFKKLDRDYLSSNYPTAQQIELRSSGSFSDMGAEIVPVYFGYRYSNGVEPRLKSVWLTNERYRDKSAKLVWRHLVWTAGDDSGIIRPIQRPLPLPPKPIIVPRKKGQDQGTDRKAQGG